MYSDELIDLLNLNTNILSVWIDLDGSWHTYEVEGCEEVKREDVITPKKKK